MVILKQSTARKLPVLLVDSGGAVMASVAEGDVTVVTSKNGGALTGFTLTDKWTELGQGLYTIDFANTDLDTEGFFAYLVTVTGCDQYSGIMYVSDWETNVDSILEDTATTLDDKINTIDTVVDAIKGKTDNLPTDPADESLIQAGITAAQDAILANEGTMETNLVADISEAESNIRGGAYDLHLLYVELDTIKVALNAIKGLGWSDENLTTIDALIDAIKAKTDNLSADPADESDLEDYIDALALQTHDEHIAIRGADSDTLKTLSDQIDTAQAAIDANGNDIDDVIGNQTIMSGKLDTAQTDLDNPDQYKADVTALALEATLDTAQVDLTYIKQKESGRWKIENNQLTYYDDLGGVLRCFNLFSKRGEPTNENPYERVPE